MNLIEKTPRRYTKDEVWKIEGESLLLHRRCTEIDHMIRNLHGLEKRELDPEDWGVTTSDEMTGWEWYVHKYELEGEDAPHEVVQSRLVSRFPVKWLNMSDDELEKEILKMKDLSDFK